MRKYLNSILKSFFYNYLIRTRTALGMTQAEMSAILSMDPRSYIELDHGKSSCSALTLALFLIYCCTDRDLFFEELRAELEKESDNAA